MLKPAIKPGTIYQIVIAVLVLLTLAACGGAQEGAVDRAGPAASSVEESRSEAAGPAGAETDHKHEDGVEEHKHGQAEEQEAGPKFDHHGNPIRQDPAYEKFVANGAAVEFTVENFLGVGGRGGELAPEIFEAELAVLKFKISQGESGEALPDLRPAVWLDLHDESAAEHDELSCEKQVQSYLGGSLGAQPDISLNSYFVLAMNDHASISVIDPMVDVGGMTNLYSAIQLPKPGADWAVSRDQQHLFVTIPETGQVTVADLEQFWAIKNLDAGPNPSRIAFQPDENYLWVGNDAVEVGQSGVTVIDPVALEVVTHIPTGAGHHEIAFSKDSRYALVTNREAGTLSIIDTRELRPVKELQVGPRPVAVDIAGASQAIYVADEAEGAITVIDGDTLEVAGSMSTKPGLAALRFAPDGRWGFVTNPEAGQVIIFDAATNRLLYELPVDGRPDQITFSPTAAYIRTGSLPAVILIPLADIVEEGTVSVLTVPMGQAAPGEFAAQAGAVSSTPGEGAMVIANPTDDQVYYYLEGSQAAMGSFQGHGLRPRAVHVLDRSLHEVAPGVYQGGVRFPRSGEYDVAFLLDSPRIVHCFKVSVKPNPELAQERAAAAPEFEFLTELRPLEVGETFTLRFALTDPLTQEPVDNLADIYALANQTAGNWNQRYVATARGEGVYEIDITIPRPGLYNLFFAVPSLQANFNQLPSLYLKATTEAAPE